MFSFFLTFFILKAGANSLTSMHTHSFFVNTGFVFIKCEEEFKMARLKHSADPEKKRTLLYLRHMTMLITRKSQKKDWSYWVIAKQLYVIFDWLSCWTTLTKQMTLFFCFKADGKRLWNNKIESFQVEKGKFENLYELLRIHENTSQKRKRLC